MQKCVFSKIISFRIRICYQNQTKMRLVAIFSACVFFNKKRSQQYALGPHVIFVIFGPQILLLRALPAILAPTGACSKNDKEPMCFLVLELSGVGAVMHVWYVCLLLLLLQLLLCTCTVVCSNKLKHRDEMSAQKNHFGAKPQIKGGVAQMWCTENPPFPDIIEEPCFSH